MNKDLKKNEINEIVEKIIILKKGQKFITQDYLED